jgi:hypothetical protein
MTTKSALIFIAITIVPVYAFAQHGMIGESGLYNFPYHGDTWTGVVSNLDPQTGHLTLSYTKKGKNEDFTGLVEKSVALEDKDGRPIQHQSITLGQKLMVYYVEKGRKYVVWDENHKQHETRATENVIFKIRVFQTEKKHS